MMGQRVVSAVLTGILLVAAMQESTPTRALTMQRFFPETGKTVSGRFLDFWQNNGGVTVFGNAISCEGTQEIKDPKIGGWYTVQWFERFRLEKHPENGVPYDVLLGRMGYDALVLDGRANPDNGTTVFQPAPPTGDFLNAWNAGGLGFSQPPNGTREQKSLALYGNPLSDRHAEFIPDENKPGTYDVQWFERARFEYHPENDQAHRVERGLLGTRLLGSITVNCFVVPTARSLANFTQVSETNQIRLGELALNDTALYGLAGSVALLFTPISALPNVPADVLVREIHNQDLGTLNRRALGALTVVRSTNPQLPPDDYLVILDSNGNVVFVGTKTPLESQKSPTFPVIIRQLDKPLPLSVAFATATKLCVGWAQTVACAQAPTPQTDDVKQLLDKAARSLGLGSDQIDIDSAVSLVAGADELEICANSLQGDQADYGKCAALVLAAPATKDDAFPVPKEQDTITSIGLVEFLTDIREEAFSDPQLTKSISKIPAGAYKVYAVMLDNERELSAGRRLTRVWLSGEKGDFYLPAVSGSTLVGLPVLGDTSVDTHEAAVTPNLILRGQCFIKVGLCPGQPR